MGAEVSTEYKSSNRIELSQLIQDLFKICILLEDLWFVMIPPPLGG